MSTVMTPERSYPEQYTNTAEIIYLDEQQRKRRLGHDVMAVDVIAQSVPTEERVGVDVHGTADKIDPSIVSSETTAETADTLATVTRLHDPESAQAHEFDREVQVVADTATTQLEDAGLDVDAGKVQDDAKERLVADAVEEGAKGTLAVEADEMTSDKGQEIVADAVVAEQIATSLEENGDAVVGLSERTKVELEAQLSNRDPGKMTSRELAEDGAKVVEELRGEGVDEVITVVDEDGNRIALKHNTETARRTAKLLRGDFKGATEGIDAEGKDHVWFKLEDLHEKYGKDLSKAPITELEFHRLERTIARELPRETDTTEFVREAA
jgi:hypothetical protein